MAEAVLANAIWASTFVFVKLALAEIGPLTIAGLRYFGGFLLLAPLVARRGAVRSLPRTAWLRFLFIGLAGYTVGNGALFWGLQHMPSTTGSLMISLTPLPVLGLSIFWLGEKARRGQIVGLIACIAGSVLFLVPGAGSAGEPIGIGLGVVALFSFATFGALGREAARRREVDTLSLTALPLALGGGLLLLLALPLEGAPNFSAQGWAIVLWLAAVNTVLAYLLYNHALKTLTALEMNVLLNLGPIGTALIAWPLLGERLTTQQLAGMIMVVLGVIAVQAGAER